MKPIAILISDVHYNLQTLRLADAAMRQAIYKANELGVPLIVAGDLHDTKANLRGECVNAMIETIQLCYKTVFILVGNHDRINEKSPEHSLNFLNNYAEVIGTPRFNPYSNLHLIPYYSNTEALREQLKRISKGQLIIMHQGLKDSHMGDYIQDHSAIEHDDVKDFRVISGHYHQRQDIKTGRPRKGAVGLFSYIGNPYTLSWGEANDPEKGFQILMDNGLLEFVPTNLRKHVIREYEVSGRALDFQGILAEDINTVQADDLLWIRIKGTHEALSQVSRSIVSKALGRDVFKLTLEPTSVISSKIEMTTEYTQAEILDKILDDKENSDKLKELWRSLCE